MSDPQESATPGWTPPQPPPPASGYPWPGFGYPPVRRTNGLAIASMVVSIASVPSLCIDGFGGLLGIVGAVLGHVSLHQLRRNGENGRGMAVAGVAVGWTATALAIILGALFVTFVVFANHPGGVPEPFPS